MDTLLVRWLGSCEDHIILFEGHDEIILRRQAQALLLHVQLTPDRPDRSQLESWIRLGHASLSHFQGSLAQAPASGALWLLQSGPKDQDKEQLLAGLENLLNQRDTWRAMITRLARPVRTFTPTSLRSLPY